MTSLLTLWISALKRWERISSKKRTKNEAKTTKPDTEWKSVVKTKSRQSPSVKKSTKVNPDKSKVKPEAINASPSENISEIPMEVEGFEIQPQRMLFPFVARVYDYEIWQIDVKTAFLNGFLDEDIYMVQPESFVDPKHPRRVCKLQRSIYGLKQASRSWNKRFDEEIKKFGFTQNLDEPCVYKKDSGSNVTFLILYVDDIIIMGNHILSLQSVKSYLGKCFAMKYLGEASFILAIKIYRDRSKRLIGLREPHWTAVKTILKYLRNTNDMFLVYGGNPEAKLRVDCYCDAGFETDRDDIKS
ncbi:retrotransposon protein, putative, ty1-copia subclass [Tanacetum coccineum]